MSNEKDKKEFQGVPTDDGFVFGQMVNGAKGLGITREEVNKYRDEHNCSTQQALAALIAEK